MSLLDDKEPLSCEIAFWMVGYLDPQYPIGQLGKLSEELSKKLRTLAIICLLGDSDTDLFYHNLIRGANVRELFLLRSREENYLTDFHLAASRTTAIFNALAANEVDLAGRIATLSTDSWMAEDEYEDDFCYAQLIHYIIRNGTDAPRLDGILSRFEQVLQGSESPRLDICKALSSTDQEAFNDAFQGLLEDRTRTIADQEARGQIHDAGYATERHIFVEGLAILNLANKKGLTTQREYPYCPALARLPMTRPFPGE